MAQRARKSINIDRGKQLVVCVDGPKSGQWHYLEDWKRLRAIAQDMAPYMHHRQTILDYKPMTYLREHPSEDGVVGNVLIYEPGWDDNLPPTEGIKK